MQKTKRMCIPEAKWRGGDQLCELLSQKIISKSWPLDLAVEATGDIDKWSLGELWKPHRNDLYFLERIVWEKIGNSDSTDNSLKSSAKT